MLKVEVIGHLGADAEVKEIRGKNYVTFSVAHKKYHRDNEGNKTETTLRYQSVSVPQKWFFARWPREVISHRYKE